MKYAGEELVAWCDGVEDHREGAGGEKSGAILARLGPCVLANPMTQDRSLPIASPPISSRMNSYTVCYININSEGR